MTTTSDQLKTVIIELDALENTMLDTKIMELACLGAEIEILQVWGTPSLKSPKIPVLA